MSAACFTSRYLHTCIRAAAWEKTRNPAISRSLSSLSPSRPQPSQPANSRVRLATPTASTSPVLNMSKRESSSGSDVAKKPKARAPVSIPRPSSSILLLSSTNQALLLHRVQTSTSFASAHVFPGGNLSSFHEGPIPEPDSPARHVDGEAYRLAAIRETFEESGILLARGADGRLLDISEEAREAGRKRTHANEVKFTDWVKELGGVPDVDNLIPFTRWITPTNMPKRFTTQMYLYMLPLSSSPSFTASGAPAQKEILVPVPTHDGGLEHTAAAFEDVHAWLAKAKAGSIILFPPQFYLLTLLTQFIPPSSASSSTADYAAQRQALTAFLSTTPTSTSSTGKQDDPTARIPWSEKAMSPTGLFMLPREDGRLVLGLDKPGPDLAGSGRGGDRDRVVLVEFTKGGPRRVEVRMREEVLRLRKEMERREEEQGAEKGKL